MRWSTRRPVSNSIQLQAETWKQSAVTGILNGLALDYLVNHHPLSWHVRCGIGSLGLAWHTGDRQTGHRESSQSPNQLRNLHRASSYDGNSSSSSCSCKRFRMGRTLFLTIADPTIDWSANPISEFDLRAIQTEEQAVAHTFSRELPKERRPSVFRSEKGGSDLNLAVVLATSKVDSFLTAKQGS